MMLVVVGVRHGIPSSTSQFLLPSYIHNVYTYIHVHTYIPIYNVLAEAVCYFPRNTMFTELSL